MVSNRHFNVSAVWVYGFHHVSRAISSGVFLLAECEAHHVNAMGIYARNSPFRLRLAPCKLAGSTRRSCSTPTRLVKPVEPSALHPAASLKSEHSETQAQPMAAGCTCGRRLQARMEVDHSKSMCSVFSSPSFAVTFCCWQKFAGARVRLHA